jgi:serine/threonine-protein kinase
MLPLVCPICDSRYPADFRVCPRDAARLEDVEAGDDDALLGSLLGDTYEVVRSIGEGGTARVYEARHVRLSGKRFAVKVLHAHHCSQPTAVARFQREAEAAAAIGHPNICDVYDVHRAPDGRPYLVTQFLEGRDFGSLLKQRGKVDTPFAVYVAREACSALSAAHATGVVHRDMKPENIFVSGDDGRPTVKILDFGISKLVDGGGAALTRTGTLIGTPAYMSPEQASGYKIDNRTDVYAMGAVLYRALTGRVPFEGSDMAEVLSGVLTVEAPRPRSLEPSIPDGLELVIQRAMAKDPDERFESMDELNAALAPFDTLASAVAEPTKPTSTPPLAAGDLERGVRSARPRAIFFSVALYAWALACVSDIVLSVLSGAGSVGRMVGVLAVVAVVLAGPFALWLRYLSRQWQNSVRVLEVASLLRAMMIAALMAPAVAIVLIRLGVAAGSEMATGLLGHFPILATVLSFAAAVVPWQSGRLRKPSVG